MAENSAGKMPNCPDCGYEMEIVTQGNIDFYYCYRCNYNIPVDEWKPVRDAEIQANTDVKKEADGDGEQNNPYNKLKIIQNSFKICSKASDSACYSASLFTIGNALHNVIFYDELGRVHTNLSFMHIVPSSGYKSPLLQVLIEIYEKEFKEQGIQYQSKFTTEGLMNSLFKSKQEWEKNNKETMPIQKIHIYRDEASNIAKESKAGRSANIWEFLSESYDGKIRPYNTIRGGYQTYPEVWMSFWFASTLTLYEQLTDDFWEQGYGFRCLFIKPEATPFTGFNLHNNLRDLEIQRIINEIIELRDIKYALPSDDWENKYNEFIEPIHDRGNEEIKKLNSADTTSMEDKADKKYPEMVIKLSLIHCASRNRQLAVHITLMWMRTRKTSKLRDMSDTLL